MALKEPTLEELRKQFLECPKCQQMFEDETREPRLLPCLHTVCTSCLTQVIQDESVECVICKTVHPTKSMSIDDFPKDNNRKELLHFFLVRSQTKDELKCEECDEATSSLRCRECAHFLCDKCAKSHGLSRFTKDHTLDNLGRLKDSSIESFKHDILCEKDGHGEQKLNMYCKKCKMVVCNQCILVEHQERGHAIKSCSDVSKVKKDKLMTRIGKLDTLMTEASKLKTSIVQTQIAVDEVKENINDQIKEFVEQCIRIVKERGTHLQTLTEEICSKKQSVLNEQLETTGIKTRNMEDALLFSKQTLEHKTPSSFLQIQPTIKRRLEEIIRTNLDSDPSENALVDIKDLNIQIVKGQIESLGSLWTTSVCPSKTDVQMSRRATPEKSLDILKIRLNDFSNTLASPTNIPVQVQVTSPTGEAIDCRLVPGKDGTITALGNVEMEGRYTAAVSVLGKQVFDGTFDVSCSTKSGQTKRGTKNFLDNLGAPVIKQMFVNCTYCKEETCEKSHRPLLLPCLHRVCESCATHLQGGSSNVRCPECKKDHTIKDIDDTPIDPLPQVMQTYLEIRQGVPCITSGCNRPSKRKCKECTFYLCEACTVSHTNHGPYQNHNVRLLEEIRKDQDMLDLPHVKECTVTGHENERLVMYCMTCQKVSCTMCFITSGCIAEGHTTGSIDSAYNELKPEFEMRLQKLQEKEKALGTSADTVEKEISEGNENHASVLKQIDDAFTRAKGILENRQAFLRENADKSTSMTKEKLEMQLDSLKEIKWDMERTRELASDQLAYNDNVSFLSIQKTMSECLTRHLNEPFNSYPCQKSSLVFEEVNMSTLASSLDDLGKTWTTDMCPWATKITPAKDMYVAQRNILVTLEVFKSTGQPADVFGDGVVTSSVTDPSGKILQPDLLTRQDAPGKIDVSFCPGNAGVHNAHIEVLHAEFEGGQFSFDVRVNSVCGVCLETMDDPKELPCGHGFCESCKEEMLKYHPTCPTCGFKLGTCTYIGRQPKDGIMKWKTLETASFHMQGHEKDGVIEILYQFPSGEHKEEDGPEISYEGCVKTAFLPNTSEGKQLLSLLKVAFDRRLVFIIEEIRDGVNGVVLSDIPHKTNILPNSICGYPDPDFFKRVRSSLRAVDVTLADIPRAQTKNVADKRMKGAPAAQKGKAQKKKNRH